VTWDQGKQWLQTWLQRINIPDFGIMGGEPLINPECSSWLTGVRQLMPSSQIRFTTNGLLLDKHWDLINLMHDLGNVSLKITVHINDTKLENTIQKIFDQFSWTPINEFGIDRWITNNNFRFHIKRPNIFTKTYQNNYNNMLPWRSDPAEAFKNCCQQTCPLLYQGKIYKCSTSGLLSDILPKVSPHNLIEWKPYIVAGIDSECADSELSEFINNFGKPHYQCGQCPTAKHDRAVIDHYKFANIK
jgi:sulfatase maturation enzyme AslB (radical SAM superfamily)